MPSSRSECTVWLTWSGCNEHGAQSPPFWIALFVALAVLYARPTVIGVLRHRFAVPDYCRCTPCVTRPHAGCSAALRATW